VYSHPEALKQCSKYLLEKGYVLIECDSTAEGARKAKISNQGCVASRICAEQYGLEILSEDVCDFKDNMTRFFVLELKNAVQFDTELASMLGQSETGHTKLASMPGQSETGHTELASMLGQSVASMLGQSETGHTKLASMPGQSETGHTELASMLGQSVASMLGQSETGHTKLASMLGQSETGHTELASMLGQSETGHTKLASMLGQSVASMLGQSETGHTKLASIKTNPDVRIANIKSTLIKLYSNTEDSRIDNVVRLLSKYTRILKIDSIVTEDKMGVWDCVYLIEFVINDTYVFDALRAAKIRFDYFGTFKSLKYK
jgi:hypothetical protein